MTLPSESRLQKSVRSHTWSIEDAIKLYGPKRWGMDFFGINKKGNVCVYPNKEGEGAPEIDLLDVITELKARGIRIPAVIRFHDILRSQVKTLNETFREIIDSASYRGDYRGVYPIKVNQMREVVEEIVDAGTPYQFGLEAGSKGEILAVLALNTNEGSLTLLNGYKDEMFLRLACLGTKIGKKMVVIVEQLSELSRLITIAREMQVRPIIGLRAKLSCKGSGKWSESSGDRAKFGLTSAEMLQAVEMLKRTDLLDSLQLFHFHMGSQITDIRTFKEAVTEGARIFCSLTHLGVPLQYFDVGGGLAVDYDGSNSPGASSRNYGLREYISDIVYILKEICDLEKVPHPHIVSESGRMITAHHSCVVVNIHDSIEVAGTKYPTDILPDHHHLVRNMREIYDDVTPKNLQESYNDAFQKKEEAMGAFKLGVIDLEERAIIETLYWKICKKILDMAKVRENPPEDLLTLENIIVEQYLCNFSVFQSAADTWAIGQLLPIMPITRHFEKPTVRATLADITCDSDGKINRFIDSEEGTQYLPLHTLKVGEEYYLGIFLTGAYQDIMGDNHNMFGRLGEVHIYGDDDDPFDFYIEESIPGNAIKDVLTTLQYNPSLMSRTLKSIIDKKVQAGIIRPREGVALCQLYEEGLSDHTYLN